MTVQIHRPSPLGGASDLDFSRCRVLILDPFIGTRRLLSDILQRDLQVGAVRGVNSREDTMRLLDEGGWNVLFTDWSADVDAIGVLRILRSNGSPHRFLPVVVMSSNSLPEEIKSARDAGMSEYILKPFTANVVQSRLRSLTQAPRTYVESRSFFGPDRRRRAADFAGSERRQRASLADRRQASDSFEGPERRLGRAR